MGMTGAQKFFRVELPLALPLVMSGVRLALVQVWATATIAALVAGPGLGRVITDGFFRTNYGKGIAGAVVVGARRAGPGAARGAVPAAGRTRPRRAESRNVTRECRRVHLRLPRRPTPSALSEARSQPDTPGTCATDTAGDHGTQK